MEREARSAEGYVRSIDSAAEQGESASLMAALIAKFNHSNFYPIDLDLISSFLRQEMLEIKLYSSMFAYIRNIKFR